MKNKYLLFICILLLFNCSLKASHIVQSITNQDGLTNNSINCIYKDSKNKLWIGTWDGLNTYNGRDFNNFRYAHKDHSSLSNNIIRQILETNESLWIVTDYGINRWMEKTSSFVRYLVGPNYTYPTQEKTYSLQKTKNNQLYCLLVGSDFLIFDNNADKFSSINLSYSQYIKDFIILDEEIYFLFQNGELYRQNINLLSNSKKVTQLHLISNTKEIKKIIAINSSKLACVLTNRIDILKNDEVVTTIPISYKQQVSDIILNQNNYFITFSSGGCIKYNTQLNKEEIIHTINQQISYFSLYIDNQGILWLGSDGNGLYKVYKYNNPFQVIHTPHPVRSINLLDKNKLLVGTKGSGILIVKRDNKEISNKITEEDGLPSNSIYTIARNTKNDFFIGGDGQGIHILQLQPYKLQKLPIDIDLPELQSIYSLEFSNNDSILWVGTSGNGMFKFKILKKNNNYQAHFLAQYSSKNNSKIKNNVIYSILVNEKQNLLWFGTRGAGLYCLNRNENKIYGLEELGTNLSLSNNDVISLAQDNNNNLWVGTSYGLNKITQHHTNYTIKKLNKESGLLDNTIHGIIAADASIWVSTNKGLSKISNQDSIFNFTQSSGLQNNEFSDGAFLKSNLLYFGGVSGLNYFDPHDIVMRDYAPNVSITQISTTNSSENIVNFIRNNQLNVSYEQRLLNIKFIADDFINNENCEYAFRVLPNNQEWSYLGTNPNVLLSTLSWGKYQLQIKATNGDRVWSDSIFELNIEINAPWWFSKTALAIYFLLLVVITFAISYYLKRKFTQKQKAYIKILEQKHKEKENEIKLNFFTNVAHEFFTPLTLIYGPSQYILSNFKLDPIVHQKLTTIKNNSERLNQLVDELIQFRKVEHGLLPLLPENVEVSQLMDDLLVAYDDIIEENKLKVELQIETILSFYTDRSSIEKIFLNLISNAFKYTPLGGEIHINLTLDTKKRPSSLLFSITNSVNDLTKENFNDQIFRPFTTIEQSDIKIKNTKSTGLGLSIVKQLTDKLNGTIETIFIEPNAIQFKLYIPELDLAKENKITSKNKNPNLLKTIHSQNKDLLIVDDENEIRTLLNDILSPIYNITEALDGQDALHKVNQSHPDLIICDVLMPNMNGFELIKSIKSNVKTKFIPIICISAKTAVEDKIQAFQNGVDLYITKPFHPEHLLIAVENLLNKQDYLKEYYNSSLSSIKIQNGIELHQEDKVFIKTVVNLIYNHIEDEHLNAETIAEYMAISKSSLYRTIKELTKSTPSQLIKNIRLEYATKLLIKTKLTVTEIMYQCGFSNKSYFYREFNKLYHITPLEYREKNKN